MDNTVVVGEQLQQVFRVLDSIVTVTAWLIKKAIEINFKFKCPFMKL